MRCPFAIWKGPIPSTNYRVGPTSKIGLVVHVIVGTEDSANNEFHDGTVHLSATFGIAGPGDDDPDGTLIQWIDTADVSYAQCNGNDSYTSVETGGDPSQPLTAAQAETLANLFAWHHTQLGVPLALVDHGGSGFTTHSHYPSGVADPAWCNHACPGMTRLQQLPGVLARAQQIVSGGHVGTWNLLPQRVLDPKGAPMDQPGDADPKGRRPCWGIDAHGGIYALNGARGVPALSSFGVNRSDIVSFEYVASDTAAGGRETLVLFADDQGGLDGTEYVASDFTIPIP